MAAIETQTVRLNRPRDGLVRDVPDHVVAALREEAEERHTSLNSIACEALAEFAARRRRRKELESLLPAFDPGAPRW